MYGCSSYATATYGSRVQAILLLTLNLVGNVIMTTTVEKQSSKSFIENIVLTTIFSKTLTMLKSFSENIKLSATMLLQVNKTFTENIVLAPAVLKSIFISFSSNIALTTIFVKIFVLDFAENIGLITFFRMIKDGITVGRWSKVAKTPTSSTIWTKQDKTE